jgi:hypothetical protein
VVLHALLWLTTRYTPHVHAARPMDESVGSLEVRGGLAKAFNRRSGRENTRLGNSCVKQASCTHLAAQLQS